MKRLLFLVGLLLSSPLWAAGSMPEPPRLPERQQSGEALEADVSIIETDRGTERRYVVNGQLYMVEVIPHRGAPYYLLDTNGDGELDAREDDIRSIGTHQWVLGRF